MQKKKVYVLALPFCKACPEILRKLEEVAVVERNPYGRTLNEKELKDLVSDADGVIVGLEKFSKEVINSLNDVQVLSRHGTGVDNIDLHTATEKGIIVTYCPGTSAESVADHTFALILALVRRIPQAVNSVRSGRWSALDFIGTELHNKTLGIVGLGATGLATAKRAKGFGMKVIYYSRTRKHMLESELGIEYRNFTDLLRESDIISIHVPLSNETRRLFDREQFDLMKSTSFLINTSRGGIINEEALYQALKSGRIAGAALDVLEFEPPVSYELAKLDNLLITPHIAFLTKESLQRMGSIIVEDIVSVFQGKRPKYVANPEVFMKVPFK